MDPYLAGVLEQGETVLHRRMTENPIHHSLAPAVGRISGVEPKLHPPR